MGAKTLVALATLFAATAGVYLTNDLRAPEIQQPQQQPAPVSIDAVVQEAPIKEYPDPYTEDPEFTDDTDAMILSRLLYGEDQKGTKEIKTAIAYTVVNRAQMKRSYFGGSVIKDVALKQKRGYFQYNCFSFMTKDKLMHIKKDNKQWQECYDIAKQVLKQQVKDPTNGATHFFHAKVKDGKEVGIQTNGLKYPWWSDAPEAMFHKIDLKSQPGIIAKFYKEK